QKDYWPAKEYIEEALQLYKNSAAKDADTNNPYIAISLNNLGVVYESMEQHLEAEKRYTEALAIYRKLARNNPQAYNHYVAVTLNNLGYLYIGKVEPEYGRAEANCKESLDIYRALAAENPQAWNPFLALSLHNMARFYQQKYPNKTLSIQLVEEAIKILDQCSDDYELVREVRNKAKRVLEIWQEN
ncbi:MAG: tetratricopeptide repeat protein, partial [Tannerellaceae bacterium]|nr:tetratricopeptide repeat protein [Tannerellaceae bacterium]